MAFVELFCSNRFMGFWRHCTSYKLVDILNDYWIRSLVQYMQLIPSWLRWDTFELTSP